MMDHQGPWNCFMASLMKKDGTNDMADDADRDNPSDEKPLANRGNVPAKTPAPIGGKSIGSNAERGGYFTIYKKGQGYWTRIGTVGGAVLIALLTAQFLYSRSAVWFQVNNRPNMPVVLGLVGGFLAIFALIVYQVINRVNVVDFLIATDSEMKKVNWTTKAELIGSTKVVIIFMLFIACLLFAFDTFFGYVFYLIKVLQFGPFG